MELDQKYKEAKMLLAELDDRQTRLARVEGMLDSGISSKDPADLQAAIQETEKNGFQVIEWNMILLHFTVYIWGTRCYL